MLHTYVTLSVKTRTSMHIEKNKIFKKIACEITHATGKYLQGLMGPVINQGSFKSTKTIYHLTRLAMENSKIFVSLTVSVSRAFVYNDVDVNKSQPPSWKNHHHR